ncbi:MAG: hypothetical protein VXW29_06685, partial [SAR324 cluster bacterium]|nr:hypothetical protein [SAR324 cluster bacterium]
RNFHSFESPFIRPSASFSEQEKGKNQLIASRQNNQIYKLNQCTDNPRPTGRGGTVVDGG